MWGVKKKRDGVEGPSEGFETIFRAKVGARGHQLEEGGLSGTICP